MRYILILVSLLMFMPGCGSDLGAIGDPCDKGSDCSTLTCLTELGSDSADPITFDGGYCTASCSYDYETGQDTCGAGEICLLYDTSPYDDVDSAENYCYVGGCETDWDCRDSTFVCHNFGFFELLKACVPYDAFDPTTRELPPEQRTTSQLFPLAYR